MSEQLLPCPFCGGTASLDRNGSFCWCKCNDDDDGCGVMQPVYARDDRAIAAWNRRVPAPAAGVPVEVADYIQYALNRAWHNVEQDWLTDEEKAKRRAPIDAALRWLASVTQQPQPGQEGEGDE